MITYMPDASAAPDLHTLHTHVRQRVLTAITRQRPRSEWGTALTHLAPTLSHTHATTLVAAVSGALIYRSYHRKYTARIEAVPDEPILTIPLLRQGQHRLFRKGEHLRRFERIPHHFMQSAL